MDEKVSELQRTLYLAAKADNARRFHSLYDKIYREDVLKEAWNRVRTNGGAAGTDGRQSRKLNGKGSNPSSQELQRNSETEHTGQRH
jgi:16S rRNA C1402 N4-methylase RsmH